MKFFGDLFEAKSVSKKVVFVVPVLILVFLTVFTQYIVYFPVKGVSSFPVLALIGGVIGVLLGFKFRVSKKLGAIFGLGVFVGFLLLPYFAFCFGPIHCALYLQLFHHWRIITISPANPFAFASGNYQPVYL